MSSERRGLGRITGAFTGNVVEAIDPDALLAPHDLIGRSAVVHDWVPRPVLLPRSIAASLVPNGAAPSVA